MTASSTAALSDALDAFALRGSTDGLGALAPGSRIMGSAFTVRYEPIGEGETGTVGDFLDDVPVGAVIVIDNGGRTDCTVWGGIMSQVAQHQGVAGTVINGVCRDTATANECDYPIFSLGRHMRTGKDRVRLAAVGETVHLGDVAVEPGDLVIGDDDGVVVIAAENVDRVRDKAAQIERTEDRIVTAVRNGQRLCDARASMGYHELQSGRPA